MKANALLTFFICLALCSSGQKNQVNYKKPAIDILTESYNTLEKTVADLSNEELRYVPTDGGWSVLNCLEHLVVTEKALQGRMKEMIEKKQILRDLNLGSMDWYVIAKVTDRTGRVRTLEFLEPKEEFKNMDLKYFLDELKSLRKQTLSIVEQCEVDLRRLQSEYPYGEIDGIQQALVIGAHTFRHQMQIEEVLAELRPEVKTNETDSAK